MAELSPLNQLPSLPQVPTSSTPDSRVEHKAISNVIVTVTSDPSATEEAPPPTERPYRLYKRRWIGVFAMASTAFVPVTQVFVILTPDGQFLLEVVSSASGPWFGPISDHVVRDFGFTLKEVNWLGNIINCVYLPAAFLTPVITKRYGVRRSCDIATVLLLLSAWVRYAGTVRSLTKGSAYTLILIGQALSGISFPVYQILAPKYSERWFDVKSRTTATMIISIANPIGGALGQLLSPICPDTRTSLLVLAVMSTAVVPLVFFVFEAPPTPPSFSGSRIPSPSIVSLIRAAVGLPCPPEAYMTLRERFDLAILVSVFSSLLAAINTFSILSSQWLKPYGYSDTTSGILGAAMLLSGIVAAIATAPAFDRIFTHHMGIAVRVLCPTIGAAWLSLIWAVRVHNAGALFAIFVVIGVCSITLLPVGIELGVELTRNPDGSSALLWFFGNLLSIIFILGEDALRASPAASPPQNMHRAIVFNSVWVFTVTMLSFFLRGHQARRELDERMNDEQKTLGMTVKKITTSSSQSEPLSVKA